MELTDANQLLDHPYLPLENGWVRFPDGRAHVAVRTHMIGCKGQMIEWWFGYIHTTEQYRWWHPRDHVFSDWQGERGTGRYIGGTHLVHEYVGPTLSKLRINFRKPSDILDTSKFEKASISAAIYARGGPLDSTEWFAHVLHLVNDTPEGCVMRSRFWLGYIEPTPASSPTLEVMKDLIPDQRLQGLQKHCSEEMSILGGFLPAIYRMYNPDN
jgi:hypothetical protein